MSAPLPLYAKEYGGCWHEVACADGPRWTAECGLQGQPYDGQHSSLTRLAIPPSPLHCQRGRAAGSDQQSMI
jgi:hypothetical protein